MLSFLRRREWVIGRRLVLVAIVLFLAYRSYGGVLVSWFARADGARDIEILQAEFRPEINGARPAWIVRFRNNSDRYTYDDIQLEAIYMGQDGTVLEQDKLTVRQRLAPGDEQIVGSVDFKSRGAATHGILKVLGAQEISR
jgi:hypothetical protein